jgi:hypothetical protein
MTIHINWDDGREDEFKTFPEAEEAITTCGRQELEDRIRGIADDQGRPYGLLLNAAITPTEAEQADREIPNTNKIEMFFCCKLCLADMPDNTSMRQWSRLDVGWSKAGIQVWCRRHNCNVLHVDFQGMKHPANAARRV